MDNEALQAILPLIVVIGFVVITGILLGTVLTVLDYFF